MKRNRNQKLKDVQQAVAPYLELWHEWIVSDECNLNAQEIIAVRDFILTGKHAYGAQELNLNISQASAILSKAQLKLKVGKGKFERWRIKILSERAQKWQNMSQDTALRKFIEIVNR